MSIDIYDIKTGKYHSNSGFSLIEISMVLVILGLLLAPTLRLLHIEQQDHAHNKTLDSIAYVRDSLVKYFLETGRYPLPAMRNVSEGANSFGEEVALGSIGVCVGNDVNPCRAGNALIGDVPFKTIGINIDHIVDGYGGKLTYSVTENMAGPGPYADDAGQLDVDTEDTVGIEVVDAHFVLISHGQDNAGAFTVGGGLSSNCPVGNIDSLNCNNSDDTFTVNGEISPSGNYKRAQYLAPGASHYDDHVDYVTSAQGYIWTYSVGQLDMESRNPGTALIGGFNFPTVVRGTSAVAKLEVMGNVDTDELTTTRLCVIDADPQNVIVTTTCPVPGSSFLPASNDPYDINVFDPAIISVGTKDPVNYDTDGRGIHCGGKLLVGIENSNEKCANFAPAGFVASVTNCAGGMVPTGTDPTGDLICVLP